MVLILLEVFFEDESVKFKPPEFYDIEISKSKCKGKKKEYLVHYVGWKKAKGLKQL